MYSVELSQNAEKQINKLDKNIQGRITNVLERIRTRPFHFIKKKEETPYFILRVGEYRCILDVNQEKQIIFVIEIGHRKNIYNF